MNSKITSGLLLLVTVICFSCAPASNKKSTPKPNVILIVSDDHGWFDVGFNGNTQVKTPNMDALASKGIILNRFYAASAVCSPTRASVITGRNPLRINIPYANTGHLKKEEITLPEMLKEQGYATGHFGKWHLGTLTKTVKDANRGGTPGGAMHYSIPSEHGYDTWFCTESKVPTYDPMVYPESFMEGESKSYGWRAVENGNPVTQYGTAYWKGEDLKETMNLKGDDSRIITDRVIPFIESAYNHKKPFFTTVWFHTPHLPVVSDSIHRNYYKDLSLKEQIYYGTLTAMDEQIGRLWKKLEELKIAENTIVFYCSDNGPERGTPGKAGVFRARKRSLYEGGVRVPAFVVWENRLEPGKRIDFPMVTSDYLPTILDILGVKYPDARPLDGMSILGALDGHVDKREKPIGFICRPKISWVTNRYKLIGDKTLMNFELYDLVNDTSEKENIIEQHPVIAEKMKAELATWLKSVEHSKNGRDYTKANLIENTE